MIGSKKKFTLSPESMQALAELPQLGLGSAPPPMPSSGMNTAPLVDMPAPAAEAGPMSMAPGDMSSLVPAAAKAPLGGGGFLSKIGDALKAPGVSAALLRSAGATLNGGLGAGIAAGTSFMDKRRAEDVTQRQAALEYALKQRLATNTEAATRQTGAYQNGQLANGAQANQVRLYGIDKGAETARYGTDAGVGNNIRSNATSAGNAALASQTSLATNALSAETSRLNNGDTVAATYAGQDASERSNLRTVGATMFGRPPTVATTTKTKAVPAESNWFGPDVAGTPETNVTTTTAQYPAVPSRDQLQAGQTYQTANGPARWDGKKFVQ